MYLWITAGAVTVMPLVAAILCSRDAAGKPNRKILIGVVVACLVAALLFTANAYHMRTAYLDLGNPRWAFLLIGLVWSLLFVMPTIGAGIWARGAKRERLVLGLGLSVLCGIALVIPSFPAIILFSVV